MANASEIDAPLTLELDGDNLTPELFLRGAKAFFALIQDVTDEIDKSVNWRVQVKAGSNLIGVSPAPLALGASVAAIVSGVGAGLATLEREAEEPPFFVERALRNARELSRLALSTDGSIGVRVWANKQPVGLSAQTVFHVDEIVAGAFEEFGAIDGRIETISQRGGAKFVVYDTLTDRAIKCSIPAEKLAVALGTFGSRAEVYGMIRYRKDGRAARIRVENIVAFPTSGIPHHDDVRGAMQYQN